MMIKWFFQKISEALNTLGMSFIGWGNLDWTRLAQHRFQGSGVGFLHCIQDCRQLKACVRSTVITDNKK